MIVARCFSVSQKDWWTLNNHLLIDFLWYIIPNLVSHRSEKKNNFAKAHRHFQPILFGCGGFKHRRLRRNKVACQSDRNHFTGYHTWRAGVPVVDFYNFAAYWENPLNNDYHRNAILSLVPPEELENWMACIVHTPPAESAVSFYFEPK